MATSVQELIDYLKDIEDKEQPVIYQYFLAEHFSATPAQFDSAVESLDCEDLWYDAHATVREYITGEQDDENDEE